jgi:HEAT repeat protein
VARLTLIGERVVEPLLSWFPSASPLARRQALKVLKRRPDARALGLVLALFDDPDRELARGAISVASEHRDARVVAALSHVLRSGPPELREAAGDGLARLVGAGLEEALEPLLEPLFDEREQDRVRIRALDALAGLGQDVLRPILRRLRKTASAELALRVECLSHPPKTVGRPRQDAAALVEALLASGGDSHEAMSLAAALRERGRETAPALNAALARTEEPLVLRLLVEALADCGDESSIIPLYRLLERLAASGDEPATAELRARVHLTLAGLGSRVALYDLRERLLSRPPQALATLLRAAGQIGDATCVPALAQLAADDPSLRDACAETLGAIVRRERLRRSSKALKAVKTEHRQALDALWDQAVGRKRRSRR